MTHANNENTAAKTMNRRQVLRQLGFGSLTVMGSGSLVTLLQACSATAMVGGGGPLFAGSELQALENLCEGILPRTQTPGAIDVGVPAHLNSVFTVVHSSPEVNNFRRGMALFAAAYEQDSGQSLATSDPAAVTRYLNGYLQRYSVDPDYLDELDAAMEENISPSDEMLEAYFVTNIIDATAWSYFTSELVGETIMRHDSVPGSWDACIDYSPGEHSWSS